MIPYTQGWAAGNSLFTSVNVYERSVNGTDSLYPEVVLAEAVTISSGRLDWNGTYGDYQIAGVVLEGMGSLSGGFWNASRGFVECTYYPNSTSLGNSSYIALMWLTHETAGTEFLSWYYDNDISEYQIYYQTDEAFPNGDHFESFTATNPAADTPITYKMCWRCGTWNGSSHASDGWLRLYINNSLAWSVEDIPFMLQYDTPTSDLIEAVAFGYAGLLGALDNISISDVSCDGELPPVTVTDELDLCCGEGQSETVNEAGGGTGNGAVPFQTPVIGEVLGCVGGGTVPTQADITHAETWGA